MHDPALHDLQHLTEAWCEAAAALGPPAHLGGVPPRDLPGTPVITPAGLGLPAALDLWYGSVLPSCVRADHPAHLSFIPNAATPAAKLGDALLSAVPVFAGSPLEGAGVVWAENQALAWLSGLAGYPPSAAGTFVQGGTLGNLSALHAARHRARARTGSRSPFTVVTGPGSHSSIRHACEVLDADLLLAAAEPHTSRLRAEDVAAALDSAPSGHALAVVATIGHTNTGVIDDIAGIAGVCAQRGVWLHVDGAYGAALLASPAWRHLAAGVELSDSFIVDPHKWLFGPYDACALLYRDPTAARAAHTQHAAYLAPSSELANPSDLAVHLSRRARGVPLWFSLVVNGTDAYAAAIDATMRTARAAASSISQSPHCELVLEPETSIVVLRRIGWSARDYQEWSARTHARHIAFVLPSTHGQEPILRLAFVNPTTTVELVHELIASLS